MKRYETANIRNIVLVGHGGTGKTSLADALAYTAGANSRLGSVDAETSLFDFEPEEVRRKTSYASAVASVEWKKTKVNVIDTPGASVFAADTRLCMRAADLAVVLVSAIDHIEVGTERVWRSADELNQPRVIFVNKLDKERASFRQTLDDLRAEWGQGVAPLQLPIGEGDGFRGIIDLLHMTALEYAPDGSGKTSVVDLPADLVEEASTAREELIEAIASADDVLIEKYLEDGELSEEDVNQGLESAIVRGELIPVMCGSGGKNIGTDALLDVVVATCPHPGQAILPEATDGPDAPYELSADGAKPLVGLVFKAAYLDMGKVCFVRVYQGMGSPDINFYNATRDARERWGQVLAPLGKKLDNLPTGVSAGDIIAVPKLKESVAGDSICDDHHDIRVVTPAIPAACIAYAIHARRKGDEDKIAGALSRVLDADPSLRQYRDGETREHLLSGMGQTHIEVAVERMKRFGGDVELTPPRIAYREMIRGKASHVEGKHKKQSGGRGQYGVVFIDMEPGARGTGLTFVNAIFGGAIPTNFIPACEKGLKDAMSSGPQAGYPVEDVKVTLTDGKYHAVDSDGRSFEIAARKAFKDAFMAARPSLMEPVMDLEIIVPDDCLGDVMGDINSRRGRVSGMDTRRGRQVIRAQVPHAEVLTYAPDLRSLSGGRGSFTMKLHGYEEVPGHLLAEIIAGAHVADEEH